MAVVVKHAKVSTIPDDPASVTAGEVVPSDWNAEHQITGLGTMATENAADYLTAASAAAAYQPLDADLTALAALSGTNTIYYRSGAAAWSPVTIGANLTFSGGTLNAASGGGGGSGRTRLTADTDFYIRADGDDANDGLSNTAGGAWLTLQGAWDNLVHKWDMAGYLATVNIATGTFEGFQTIFGPNALVGGKVVFKGAGVGSTVISPASTTGICLWGGNPGPGCALQDLTLDGTAGIGNGTCVYLQNSGVTWRFENVNFVIGGGGQIGIWTDLGAAALIMTEFFGPTATTMSGSGYSALYAAGGSKILLTAAVTYAGTPSYSAANIQAEVASTIQILFSTFAGSVTGKRYDVTSNAVIQNVLSGTIPGTVAGTTSSGGQYV